MASAEQYERTPESQKTIDDLILGAHLTALIAAERIVSADVVEIEADDGVVTIKGTVGSLGDADRVRMIVREAPGVKDINSRMRVRSTGGTV